MELGFAVYMVEQVFIVFALDRFMHVFFEKRRTPPWAYALSYMAYLAGTVPAFFLLRVPLVNMSCSIASIFLVTLNYESALKRKISAVCFIYAFMFTTDIFVASMSGFLFRSPVDRAEYDAAFGYVAIGLLLYLEAVVARNFRNIRKNNPVPGLYWVSSAAIPLASIYIAVPVLESRDAGRTAQVSAIAVIFLVNVLAFYLHDSLSAAYADRLRARLNEREKEYYHSQCGLMRESMEELRAFRHDIKNNLSVLDGYIREGRCEEAAGYVGRLIGEVSPGAYYSDTGNTAFDSIINYKLRKAGENGVGLRVSVSVPRELEMDVQDVAAILGNLLDNAVEAVLGAETREIRLEVGYRKGRVLIFLENTYGGRVIRKNGDPLTTKGGGHGYGLRNARRALEKYNGCMDIGYGGGVFSVDVLLYAGTGKGEAAPVQGSRV